jgi:membrane protein implicated in regulation of membrane protease activity
MQVIEFVASYGAWSWIVAGLILLGLELAVPGGYLLWLGISGIITGGVVFISPISWPMQWLLFGILSLVSIVVWVRWTRGRQVREDRPNLNRRTDALVGQHAVLSQAIEQGFGRIALGDSYWRVTGDDMPVGTRVKIVGSEGPILRVVADPEGSH